MLNIVNLLTGGLLGGILGGDKKQEVPTQVVNNYFGDGHPEGPEPYFDKKGAMAALDAARHDPGPDPSPKPHRKA